MIYILLIQLGSSLCESVCRQECRSIFEVLSWFVVAFRQSVVVKCSRLHGGINVGARIVSHVTSPEALKLPGLALRLCFVHHDSVHFLEFQIRHQLCYLLITVYLLIWLNKVKQ